MNWYGLFAKALQWYNDITNNVLIDDKLCSLLAEFISYATVYCVGGTCGMD